jgi:hydrogenase maturation protease
VHSRQNTEKVDIWIIGFGNRNRRDDGSGPQVADRLKGRFDAAAGVNVVSLHQLGPELAEDLQSATLAIFIDAAQGALPGRCSWRSVRPDFDLGGIAHSLTAGALLGLTRMLYKRCPPAWMVSIAGSDFGFGEGLSRAAAEGADRATREISRRLHGRLSAKTAPSAANDHTGAEGFDPSDVRNNKPHRGPRASG